MSCDGYQCAVSCNACLVSRLRLIIRFLLTSIRAKVCSSVLGTDDIVFGHVVSGRSIPLDGALDIAGPLFKCVFGARHPVRDDGNAHCSTVQYPLASNLRRMTARMKTLLESYMMHSLVPNRINTLRSAKSSLLGEEMPTTSSSTSSSYSSGSTRIQRMNTIHYGSPTPPTRTSTLR